MLSVKLIFEVLIRGLVTKIESKDYYVLTDSNKSFRCTLRGKFKKDFALKKNKLYLTDIVAVGDLVDFDINKDGSGVIYKVEERKNYLSRKAPRIKGASYRGERLEQIIASNIDQALILCSIKEPAFNNRTLDRFLIAAESAHIDSIIVINKSDLGTENQIERWIKLYENIGYKIISTSIVTKSGLDELSKLLLKKKTVLLGQSGVGKSSILNIIYPNLDLKVGNISDYSGKGTHTTVTSVMIPFSDNTFIIDTPGVREIDPYGIKKEDLGHYFIEFNKYLVNCKFNTCIHDHEPECSVVNAVEKGEISEVRYDSYLRLLNTIETDLFY